MPTGALRLSSTAARVRRSTGRPNNTADGDSGTTRAPTFESRRRGSRDLTGEPETGWLFPSSKSASGHLEEVFRFYAPIGKVAGTRFWYHGPRHRFIAVTERELLLPRLLTR